MKRECAKCEKMRDERHFDEGMDICRFCLARMDRQANAYAEKAVQRVKNARTDERRMNNSATEDSRTAERQKAPPREYPWPWRRSRDDQ